MEENNSKTTDNTTKILSSEEQIKFRKTIKRKFLKSLVGLPLLVIIILSLFISLINIISPDLNIDNTIQNDVVVKGTDSEILKLSFKIIMYGISLSILWLCYGIYMYIQFLSNLKKKKEDTD